MLRSHTTGLRATIFGAYGFLGRYVTALVAGSGTQVVVPFRGDDLEWRHLRVMGDLGGVVPVPFSPKNPDSVRRCIEGSDIVINLIGKDYETKHILPWMINTTFEEVNVKIPEMIAKISVEQGVTNLVHLSALAADPYSISAWGRTKALGEEAVRAVAPGASIIRPSDMFGPEDRFLNLFAMLHQAFGRVPLVEGGNTRVQPVYVNDVAKAIYKVALSEDPEVMLGQTYELAGPEEYTHKEVVEYVFDTIKTPSPEVVNVSPAVADAMGLALGVLPSPLLTRDRVLRMQSDVVLDDMSPTKRLHDLELEATSMEMPGFNWLHRFRSGSHLRYPAEAETRHS